MYRPSPTPEPGDPRGGPTVGADLSSSGGRGSDVCLYGSAGQAGVRALAALDPIACQLVRAPRHLQRTADAGGTRSSQPPRSVDLPCRDARCVRLRAERSAPMKAGASPSVPMTVPMDELRAPSPPVGSYRNARAAGVTRARLPRATTAHEFWSARLSSARRPAG